MVEETPALVVRIEAAAGKFEAQLKKATNALNREATTMDRRVGRLNTNLSNAGAGFGKQLTSEKFTSGIRAVGFQFETLARTGRVSMESLSSGLVGVAGSFGPLGLAAAAVVSVMAPLARTFFDADTSADELKEQLGELKKALDDYTAAADAADNASADLARGIGMASEEYEKWLEHREELARGEVLAKAFDRLKPAREELERISDVYSELAGRELGVDKSSARPLAASLGHGVDAAKKLGDALGITSTAAGNLVDTILQLKSATDIGTARDLLVEMEQSIVAAAGGYQNLTEEGKKLLTLLKDTNDSLNDVVKKVDEVRDQTGRVVEAVEDLSDTFGRLPEFINAGRDSLVQFEDAALDAATRIEAAFATAFAPPADFAISPNEGQNTPLHVDTDTSRTLLGHPSGFRRPARRPVRTPARTRPGGGGTTDQLAAAIAAIEKQNAALRLEAQLIGLSTREKVEAKTRQELLTKAVEDGTAATEAEIAAIEKVAQAAGLAAEQLEAKTRATQDAEEAERAHADALAEGVQGMFDAVAAAGTLEEKLQALGLQILKIVATQAFQPGGLSGIGGLFGSLFGATSAGGSAAGGIVKRAMGGPIMANTPVLLGESGPELVQFASPGIVHSAPQTRSMMAHASLAGGGDINMPINIDARGAQAGVAEQISAALEMHTRQLVPVLQQLRAQGR